MYRTQPLKAPEPSAPEASQGMGGPFLRARDTLGKVTARFRSPSATAAATLKPPIFLFGNSRSGTTITQTLIGLHPDIVTWYEPRTLWRCADPGRQHDEFDESDATETIVRYIRKRFLLYQVRHGNRQIMENTPSNVLRIPYVHAIFPEAICLYIVRNPFSCISSSELKWRKAKTLAGLRRTLAVTPVTQLHYYAGDVLEHMVLKRLLRRKYISVFGPRYPGIDRDAKVHGKLRVIAQQWVHCSRKARADLAALGPGRVLTFRYEDLVQDPDTVLTRIYDHCGLTCDDGIRRRAREMIDPGRQKKWTRLDAEELKAIVPAVREEMAVYGYEVPPALR